jgi:hypothetical protein
MKLRNEDTSQNNFLEMRIPTEKHRQANYYRDCDYREGYRQVHGRDVGDGYSYIGVIAYCLRGFLMTRTYIHRNPPNGTD